MKLALKIIYNILFISLSSILLLLLYNFINLKVLKNDYTSIFGYTIFEIASGSMSPVLEKNDIVIVKIDNNVDVNDIITYKKENTYITHRVSKIQGNFYICKGDANNTYDEPIKSEVILGKVVKVFPKVGIWKIVFTTPKVVVSIIITLILFELAFFYKKNNKFSDYSISGNKIIEEIGDEYEE